MLYGQIVSANADQVLALLTDVRDRAGRGHRGRRRAATGAALEALLAEGVAGTLAIPGKHGGPVRPTGSVFVSLPDHPGELARLFADAGESEVNIEDVRIDHDPGRDTGLVELVVEEDRAEHLLTSLEARGLGDPPVGSPLVSSASPRLGNGVVVAVDGTSGIGEVEHVPRRREAAGAALPRHGRDVPRGHLVDAPPRRRRPRPRGRRGALRRAADRVRHRPVRAHHRRRRRGRGGRDPRRRRQRRGVPGERRPPGARPAAGDAAPDHRGGDRRGSGRRHRRGGPGHRLRGLAGRPGQGLPRPPTRAPGPRAVPPRRAGATSRRPATRCSRATRSTPAGPCHRW